MNYAFYTFMFAILTSSCASVPARVQNQESRGSISFSSVEKLEMGQSKAADLIRIIGNPDEIKPFRENTEIWAYLEGQGGQKSQRLNLIVDRTTMELLSATWIPKSGEPISTEAGIMTHFSGANFSRKEVGLVADAFSGDVTYQDRKKGISFYVSEGRHEIEVVGFGRPENRVPAEAKGLDN